MTCFAIIGGSGTVGRYITAALQDEGSEVRVLGRSSAQYPVDLSSGAGLAAALSGVDVVVDASNGNQRRPEPVLVDGARRLVAAAATAGVAHFVGISIVGIERVPARYYRAKLAQEEIVRSGGVAWTIVRSTQFHELLVTTLAGLGRWQLTPRSQALLQPIAAREAALAVAQIATGSPQTATVTVSGPEPRTLSSLARAWSVSKAGRKDRLFPVVIPLPPPFGARLRDGALTCRDPDHRGEVTFERWLQTTS